MFSVLVMDEMVSQLLFLVLLLSGVQCSIKKGIGVGPRNFLCNDFDAMDNMHWWYDWGANFDKIEANSGCDINSLGSDVVDKYVSMIWGYNPNWNPRVREPDHSEDFYLAFNEPNHRKQANLTPKQAVDAWPIVEQNAGNRKIVSPAAAQCGGGETNCIGETEIAWFQDFFSLLCVNETVNGIQPKTCRVDYIATHIYTCKAPKVGRLLQELYDEFQLKIWLTEFACPYSTDPYEQKSFMEAVLPILEEADHVFRYAWFVHRSTAGDNEFVTSAISLLEPTSSTLTTLGEYYNSFTYGSQTTTTSSSTSSSTTSTTSTTSTSTSSSTSTTSVSTSSSRTSASTPTGSTTTASTTAPNITTVGSNARRNISMYNDNVHNVICFYLLMSVLYNMSKG
ncbi:uncharacterized protein LOC123533148 isoform X2 [Mercenaria mercenaria]|uniref:uncharacterized protein LOC123533148 isoform X2 n=1 Tax=Mercenaria mercenaria TaxID=6596 RepID=UPI00234F2594|nr:uncharacterized protein LOC123533148 isoform X2 [Mercenaria mercenaria]